MRAGEAGANRIELPAQPDSISRLWDWLAGRLGPIEPGPELLHAIRLCAEEIATNIVMHAYPDRTDGTFAVGLEADSVADGAVRLLFEDWGIPFDPTAHAPAAAAGTVAEAEIGGLGIPLVRGFVQQMAYERRGAANRLTLVFARGAS